jgi:HAE1 family hydrophobic/amphiphilic exporter-1
MTLSDISIKNPVFAWMMMIALLLFGGIGLSRMGVSMLPDVDFPVITVGIAWEGAAPEVMETEVTDVVEDAVIGIQGVKEISSSSRQGQATISIEFELNKDIDVALQEVQTKLAQAQRNLPRDIDPPIITKTNPEDQPIMWLSLSGNRDRKFLMEYTENFLKDQFTTIPGVGEVFLGGFVDPNLRVWLDRDKLFRNELTVEDVIFAIASEHSEVPAGRIENSSHELNIRVMGEAKSVEEFENMVIPSRSGIPLWRTFRIKDVARVEDGLADIRRISRTNGIPSVGLGIRKQRGTNAVDVARAVKKKVEELRKNLPEGLALNVNFDSTRFIEENSRELLFMLVLSAVLTSFVCWLFLGSFSSAFNIVIAIPTSIVGSFLIIYFLGFTLNTFTLLGLSLAIGIVVDDAIMVLENIVRHREGGMSRVKAAIVGAREITFAALSASIAILAIFIPVVFMKGIIGRFFFQYGVTMSVAVLLSLFEALTFAPMRCSQFLEVGHTSLIGRGMEWLMERSKNGYRRLLEFFLNHRIKVILVALIIFFLSLQFIRILKKEFVPAQDQSIFLIRIQTPLGSAISFTDEVFKKIESVVGGHKEVQRYFCAIGGFGGGEVNTGVMFVTMKNPDERPVVPSLGRPYTQQEFMAVLRKELKGIQGVEKAVVQDLSLAGFTAQRGFPVEFTIRGPDWDTLGRLSSEFIRRMNESGKMIDVDSDYLVGMPEIRIVPDRKKAGERGVSISTISETISALYSGARIGKYTKGGRRYDIRVSLIPEQKSAPDSIKKLWVRNNRGELVALSDVIKIVEQPALLSVTRKNRERAITIFANVASGSSQDIALKEVEKISKELLPEGYRIVFSGSAQVFRESFRDLLFALYMGILIAYMVLASQFNSYIHPLSVLMALPFSATGAFIALYLTGNSLNIYSMIGMILLMGIVKKNSILLVDFTNVRRRQGMNVKEALLTACPIRFRPIIMTSITTIAAAVPPALALGPGAETRMPMAVVVIGGVLFSTLLTLFVVPCVYSLLSRFESRRHEDALKEAVKELGE